MAAIIQNNLNVVIANNIGQWMWAYVMGFFLLYIVITWFLYKFVEPKKITMDIVFYFLTFLIFILTVLSIIAAVNFAFNYPDPLSEAEKNLLDMANQGWKVGFTALGGVVVYYWRLRIKDQYARR